MQNDCFKIIKIKSGTKMIILDDNAEKREFEILNDLDVKIPCHEYYQIEKQDILNKENN